MQDITSRILDIILYDCGWGCRDYGCQDGPHAAQLDQAMEKLPRDFSVIYTDLHLRDLDDRSRFKNKHETFDHTVTSVTRLAERCYTDTKNNVLPIVVGGDHSSAIGTWSGVVSALEMEDNFGLIWIDAHMDAHTPETSEQGKWGGWWHGMPVAAITGEGAPEFTDLVTKKRKLKAEHIVLIGIRSFEPGEEDYIKAHGIKCYMAEEVKARGFQTIYDEAIAYIQQNCRGFGVSIDLDGFDPEDAPGVGTPEKNGVRAEKALNAFKGLGRHPDFHGLEIVEYNPHNGLDGRTRGLIHDLIKTFFE